MNSALEAWYRCLDLYSYEYKIVSRIADGLRKKGDLVNSRKYYLRALQENPHDPYSLMGLGQIAVEQGADEEALRYFEKLIAVNSRPVGALTAAANIYRKRKSFEKAMELYEKALDLEPKNPYALSGKADCLRGMKRYPSAIRHWEIALENGMDQKIGLTRIGDSYISLNDFERAETNYRKAMSIGYDKYAYLGMTKVHAMKDRLDKALEILKMLVDKEPGDQRISAESKILMEKYPQVREMYAKDRSLNKEWH